MTAEPLRYPGRLLDKVDGRTVTIDPPAAARASILARVPTRLRVRVRLLTAKLERERFVNDGLRERIRVAEVRHDQTLDELDVVVDEQARVLGHAHPAIVGVRAIIGEARVR